jgi:hypothetical protein
VTARTGYRCDKCHMPAIQVDGRWQHAEPADAMACAIFSGNLPAGETEDDQDH